MSFSQTLIKAAQPFLESIKKCDFIQGVLNNDLDSKALVFYVSQ
ncbi:hypothetical protein [Lactobacillus sp. Sy-1]|nr:hypothetical protein [Lactobacillus sp. Sy-1]